MNSFNRNMRAIGRWLGEKQLGILGLLLASVTPLAVVFSLRSECAIRWLGLFLQTVGIVTVWWGIYETRKLFGHPSSWERFQEWLRRFPLTRKAVVVASSGVSSLSVSATASGYVSRTPRPDSTLEEKLAALEFNLATTTQRVDSLEREMKQELRKLDSAVKNESSARDNADRQIHDQLKAFGTGGLHISAFGGVMLFVGSVLATMSGDITKWLANATVC